MTRTPSEELAGILARIEAAKDEGRRGEHDEFARLGRWAYRNRDLLEPASAAAGAAAEVRC